MIHLLSTTDFELCYLQPLVTKQDGGKIPQLYYFASSAELSRLQRCSSSKGPGGGSGHTESLPPASASPPPVRWCIQYSAGGVSETTRASPRGTKHICQLYMFKFFFTQAPQRAACKHLSLLPRAPDGTETKLHIQDRFQSCLVPLNKLFLSISLSFLFFWLDVGVGPVQTLDSQVNFQVNYKCFTRAKVLSSNTVAKKPKESSSK